MVDCTVSFVALTDVQTQQVLSGVVQVVQGKAMQERSITCTVYLLQNYTHYYWRSGIILVYNRNLKFVFYKKIQIRFLPYHIHSIQVYFFKLSCNKRCQKLKKAFFFKCFLVTMHYSIWRNQTNPKCNSTEKCPWSSFLFSASDWIDMDPWRLGPVCVTLSLCPPCSRSRSYS